MQNVKAKPQKCKKITFLCNIVSKDRVKPDQAKPCIIRDIKAPTCVKELLSCLDLMGIYRRFVPNYQIYAAPLYKLLNMEAR